MKADLARPLASVLRGPAFQRLPRSSSQSAAPPIVHEVLRSSGKPLDRETRAFFEPRFGHDFGKVRVHVGSQAAESTHAVNATAYTLGNSIVWGQGCYPPVGHAGLGLMAHELAHTLQSGPRRGTQCDLQVENSESNEKEAEAAAQAVIRGQIPRITQRTTIGLARQASPKGSNTQSQSQQATATQPMTRTDFEKILKEQYRVQSITTGTFRDQAVGDMDESKWQSWDPGSSSTTYTWIVEAFRNFETVLGGTPPVNKIVFLESHYAKDAAGHWVAEPNSLSSYGRGELTIYKKITTSNVLRQVGDAFARPTAEQAVRRNITHELGHGIAEIALDQPGSGPAGQDPRLFEDYKAAVGWTTGSTPQLFDIQFPGVRDALNQGKPPPKEAQITPDNWHSSKWKERPVTQYMTDNPGDDFAEAIMAYVNEPDTLRLLSPARYKFIDERKSQWAPQAKKHMNVWEAARKGGPPRTMEPHLPPRRPNIWERSMQAQ